MKKKTMWLAIAAAVVVLGISGALFLQSHPGKPASAGEAQPASSVLLQFQVTKEDLVNTVEVKGKSSYQKETRVYAPFGAEVLKWTISEGSQVKKGELLFELDATQLRSDIAQLESTIKKQELEAELNQFRQASGSGSPDAGATISESEARDRFAKAEEKRIQQQLNAVTSASSQLQLTQKRKKLEQTQFLAPEDGIFLFEDSAKIPQSVAENERIGKLVDLTKLQLVCTVGEFDIFRIKPGLPVAVKVEALKQAKLLGKVEKVSKFAKSGTDQGSGSAQFEVTISLEPHEELIAGLSLTGTIETEKRAGALVVPTLAVQREKDAYFVMLQTPQGPEKRNIEIGLETAEKTEVLKGLQEGDTVVLQ